VVLVGGAAFAVVAAAGRWACLAGYSNVTTVAAPFSEWARLGLPVARGGGGCPVKATARAAAELLAAAGGGGAVFVDMRLPSEVRPPLPSRMRAAKAGVRDAAVADAALRITWARREEVGLEGLPFGPPF
jgi:hypothetical protein